MTQFYKNYLILLLLITHNSGNAKVLDDRIDPYKNIEHVKLKNGMSVYFAPSDETNLTEIRLDVGVGWDAEDKTNFGISHLLEHVLFRDKQLKEEMSYLQIIKEAGGSANGSTSAVRTSYFGSIPAQKAQWMMDIFSKMILKPNMTAENVEKEKSTVELEIGRPGPVSIALGFNPMEKFYPKYLQEPSFWEKEFGIKNKEKFTKTDVQLSNRKLNLKQITDHYNNYYYPSNMKLFVAGKYSKKTMMNLIDSTWGKLPMRDGLKMPALDDPKPKLSPYAKIGIAESHTAVYIGTKAWNYTNKEQEILSSYTHYLSHRLMKEIRNTKGQAYTAHDQNYFYKNYGYTYVGFQTPKENFESNLKLLRTYINFQAKNGNLKPEEVQEAISLHLSDYHLKGTEAKAMMDFAEQYDIILRNYGNFTSPYSELKNTTTEEYNNILKKFFKPEQRYEYFSKAPLFFAFDYIIFYGLTLILTFTGLRSLLTKEFKNDHIRWVRKIKYPPLKLLELGAITLGFIIYAHVAVGLGIIFDDFNFLQSNLFFGQYLAIAFSISLMVVIFQITLSTLPRKLMIMDDFLMIKSVSYYSRKIPLSEIESVEVSRTFMYPFPPEIWIMKVGLRYYNFNFKFWKKGLMVNLKNGKSYFFSVEHAEAAHGELLSFLAKNKNEKIEKQVIAA